jgi:hypothetical protein
MGIPKIRPMRLVGCVSRYTAMNASSSSITYLFHVESWPRSNHPPVTWIHILTTGVILVDISGHEMGSGLF